MATDANDYRTYFIGTTGTVGAIVGGLPVGTASGSIAISCLQWTATANTYYRDLYLTLATGGTGTGATTGVSLVAGMVIDPDAGPDLSTSPASFTAAQVPSIAPGGFGTATGGRIGKVGLSTADFSTGSTITLPFNQLEQGMFQYILNHDDFDGNLKIYLWLEGNVGSNTLIRLDESAVANINYESSEVFTDGFTGLSGPYRAAGRADACPVCGGYSTRDTWVHSGYHKRLTCPGCADPKDWEEDWMPPEGDNPLGVNED